MGKFRTIAAAALVTALFVTGLALADDDDQERARRALENGEALPFSQVLESVLDKVEGEVVGVEMEWKKGRYVYEFKVITPSGRLREVYVDALTTELLPHEDD